MKLINKLALVLLIVGFPLASWYYLHTGLEFRKQALTKLKPKSKPAFIDKIGSVYFKDKTSILFKDESIIDDMKKVNEQFRKTPGFQIIELINKPINREWKTIVVDHTLADLLSPDSIYLIDEEVQFRNSYAKDKEAFKELVQHTSIVLPLEKDPDIKIYKDQ